jgi:hypothetical protein
MVSKQVVRDGTVITKPTCDVGGAAAYSFEMTQSIVDMSLAPPREAMYLSAIDNGTSWTAVIHLKDTNNGDFSAGYLNVQAIFYLECAY